MLTRREHRAYVLAHAALIVLAVAYVGASVWVAHILAESMLIVA